MLDAALAKSLRLLHILDERLYKLLLLLCRTSQILDVACAYMRVYMTDELFKLSLAIRRGWTASPSKEVYVGDVNLELRLPNFLSPPREGWKEDSKQNVAPTLRRTTKQEPKNSSSAPVLEHNMESAVTQSRENLRHSGNYHTKRHCPERQRYNITMASHTETSLT